MDRAIACKPDLEECVDRIDAWLHGRKMDRPLVRFARHNAEYAAPVSSPRSRRSHRERWFDIDGQLERFEAGLAHRTLHGETFPVYWPNLGPNVLAACYGCPYEFGEVTAWADPLPVDGSGGDPLGPGGSVRLDWDSVYLRTLDAMTDRALEQCQGRYLVGYTDLHPGLDLYAALRGTERTLFDLLDEPERILRHHDAFLHDFLAVYDRYDAKLRGAGQPSATWMGIPARSRMHIPSCDFSAMISPEQFRQFAWDGLAAEMREMDANIFHVDGPGVARHIESILSLPNLHALQWVQGQGDDLPILQWVPLLKRIQESGKGIVIDLAVSELDGLMSSMGPDGVFLWVSTESEEQELEILRRLRRW